MSGTYRYSLSFVLVTDIALYNKTYRRRNSEMRSWQVHESRRSDDSINSRTKVRLKSSNVLTFLFSTLRSSFLTKKGFRTSRWSNLCSINTLTAIILYTLWKVYILSSEKNFLLFSILTNRLIFFSILKRF